MDFCLLSTVVFNSRCHLLVTFLIDQIWQKYCFRLMLQQFALCGAKDIYYVGFDVYLQISPYFLYLYDSFGVREMNI